MTGWRSACNSVLCWCPCLVS